MAKEDYSQMYDAIAETAADRTKRGPRREYNAQEARELAETMQTSGRKGAKMPRVNFAFTPTNYEYICTMARVTGCNMTEFINRVITEHREAHAELYGRALAFRSELEEGPQ